MDDRGRIEVTDVTVSYDAGPVLRGLTFSCGPGEVVGVLGPNGAGKTTLLNAILGLVPLDSGTVRIEGGPVGAARRRIGYVPQRAGIDWDYPAVVRDVVAMGRYVRRGMWRRLTRDDRRKVAEALDQVGLSAYADTPIGALSGGQQQRMFLARSLAQKALTLLLDEPFAGIDPLTAEILRGRLLEARKEGATLLVVTHDVAAVDGLCDRVLLLNRRVVAFGPPGDVLTYEHVSATYGGLPQTLARRGR